MIFAKEQMENLNHQFQRIFTLPLTKTTFRELQNAIVVAAGGDTTKANSFLETLMTRGEKGDAKGVEMQSFIEHFCIPVRVAKEVHDRGDILSMLTSDMGTQGDNIIFSTRIRRIDGGEFHYLTDTEGLLSVVDHYLSRLTDASKTATGKTVVGKYNERLKALKEKLNQLSK